MIGDPCEKARRFLERPARLEEEIALREAYIRGLSAPRPDGTPPEETARRRLQALRQEAEALRQQRDAARRETAALLARLPHAGARTLLDMRYLSRLPWDTIGEALRISPRAALRRHRRALLLAAGFLDQ